MPWNERAQIYPRFEEKTKKMNSENPCICPTHFPEVLRILNEMKKEVMFIANEKPNRRHYILQVIKEQIRNDIVEKRLKHARKRFEGVCKMIESI